MELNIIVSRPPRNDITSVRNFMKLYQAVQTLLVGDTDGQTDRWFDKPTFIFWK
jgi:hypothetical protein